MAYRSSVLLCDMGECWCPVCGFLGGDRSVGTLLAVIAALDGRLADIEVWERNVLYQWSAILLDSEGKNEIPVAVDLAGE